LKNYPLKQFNR